jgi:hypothetical protein
MQTNSAYQAIIQLAKGPEEPKEQQALKEVMGFSYHHQGIKELIFTLTVCHIDISIAIITLSQYADNPTKDHYQAVKAVFI